VLQSGYMTERGPKPLPIDSSDTLKTTDSELAQFLAQEFGMMDTLIYPSELGETSAQDTIIQDESRTLSGKLPPLPLFPEDIQRKKLKK
jgi:hypothetical protein